MKRVLFSSVMYLICAFCFPFSEAAADWRSCCMMPRTSCCCDCDFIYVGGGFTYSITNLPQNVLVATGADFERNPVIFDGIPQTQCSDMERYRWNAYIGYERLVTCNWSVGVEFGYRDLGRLNTQYIGALETDNGVVAAPFRNFHSWALDGLLLARYQFCCGPNFFAKLGAAIVRTDIDEGNFFSARNPTISFNGPFSTYHFRLHNLYPELVIGVGYRICNWVNIVVAYGHIFGPTSTTRFLQEVSEDNVLRRPAQCPGFDYVTVGIEVPFNIRAICRCFRS